MLRLVQWAYNLGVQTERRRIASYLQVAQDQTASSVSRLRAQLADPSMNWEKEEAMHLEKRIAVDESIINIIGGLFRSEDKYQRGSSVMFPEKEKE